MKGTKKMTWLLSEITRGGRGDTSNDGTGDACKPQERCKQTAPLGQAELATHSPRPLCRVPNCVRCVSHQVHCAANVKCAREFIVRTNARRLKICVCVCARAGGTRRQNRHCCVAHNQPVTHSLAHGDGGVSGGTGERTGSTWLARVVGFERGRVSGRHLTTPGGGELTSRKTWASQTKAVACSPTGLGSWRSPPPCALERHPGRCMGCHEAHHTYTLRDRARYPIRVVLYTGRVAQTPRGAGGWYIETAGRDKGALKDLDGQEKRAGEQDLQPNLRKPPCQGCFHHISLQILPLTHTDETPVEDSFPGWTACLSRG